MMPAIAIALGGAAGSLARWTLAKTFPSAFPWGTIAVNLLGCFIAGALWVQLAKAPNNLLRLLLITGFCGGFTTFSAFSLEAVQLLNAGRWLSFTFYFTISTVGGLAATLLAYKIFGS